MKAHLLSYLRYNLWANECLIAYLRTLPDAHINQEMVSSFPSIRKTMLHNWDAEVLWQFRLQGISLPAFPSASFHGDTEEMFQNILDTSAKFVAILEAEKTAYLNEKVTYSTISYGGTTQTRYNMIHHCMNHSTYHRGQVTMMLRQLGYTNPPHLDFMLYKMG
jgi:uncharacterized damage-inducible protein DinB